MRLSYDIVKEPIRETPGQGSNCRNTECERAPQNKKTPSTFYRKKTSPSKDNFPGKHISILQRNGYGPGSPAALSNQARPSQNRLGLGLLGKSSGPGMERRGGPTVTDFIFAATP
ncbi:hypothetical protein NDU88_001126 [Pleurodeles waltl]|uniref:Uncharacterized protein n=1 Tax=Pleurodeles waltl TaxID=8319 RepID=A0AAV7SYN5_PLEWA|nr:hypothetical protein NDU88_001126 [Pleurodeles waltl]